MMLVQICDFADTGMHSAGTEDLSGMYLLLIMSRKALSMSVIILQVMESQ